MADDLALALAKVAELEGRLRRLESMIGGEQKTLQSGGNRISVGPAGIEIVSANDLTINARKLELNVSLDSSVNCNGNLTLSVGKRANLLCNDNLNLTTAHLASLSFGSVTTNIRSNSTVTIGVASVVNVGATSNVTIGAQSTKSVGAVAIETIGGTLQLIAGQNLQLRASGKATLNGVPLRP